MPTDIHARCGLKAILATLERAGGRTAIRPASSLRAAQRVVPGVEQVADAHPFRPFRR